MDIEAYRTIFFNHPNIRMEIYRQTDFGSYDELKKAVEDASNESIPGFYLVRKIYEDYNKTFEETYSGNLFDEKLESAKAKASQVSLEVYDNALVKHYLTYKAEVDQAQRAEEAKAKADEEAKKKAALEF